MITYVDGKLSTTLRGDRIVAEFIEILNNYVAATPKSRQLSNPWRTHWSPACLVPRLSAALLRTHLRLVIQHNHRTFRSVPARVRHDELNQVESWSIHKFDRRLGIARRLQ
jgi:hypothetical protein